MLLYTHCTSVELVQHIGGYYFTGTNLAYPGNVAMVLTVPMVTVNHHGYCESGNRYGYYKVAIMSVIINTTSYKLVPTTYTM